MSRIDTVSKGSRANYQVASKKLCAITVASDRNDTNNIDLLAGDDKSLVVGNPYTDRRCFLFYLSFFLSPSPFFLLLSALRELDIPPATHRVTLIAESLTRFSALDIYHFIVQLARSCFSHSVSLSLSLSLSPLLRLSPSAERSIMILRDAVCS